MGGGNTTQTTTSNQPYAGAQPLLNQGMQDALRLYQQGNLAPRPNTMSTVVPYSQQTMQGLNGIQQNSQNAMNQNAMGGALNSFQNSYGQDGFNAQQRSAMGGMSQFANGAGNVNTSFFDQLAGNGGQQNSGRDWTDTRVPGENGNGPRPGQPGGDFIDTRVPGENGAPRTGGGTPPPPDFKPPPGSVDTQRLFQSMQTPGGNGGGIDGLYGGGSQNGISGQAVQPRSMGGIDGQAVMPRGPQTGGGMPLPPGISGQSVQPQTGGGMPLPSRPGGGMPPAPGMGSPQTGGGLPQPGPQTGGDLPTPDGFGGFGGGGQGNGGGTGYGAFAGGAGDIGTQRVDQLGQMATNGNPAMAGYNSFANGGGDVSASSQQRMAQTGGNNPALSGFQSLSGTQDPSVAESNLMNIAQGGYLNRNDPNFEAALARSTDAASTAVNQQASAMGRTGSGANQGVLAREIGNLQTDARLGQYNQERQNQTNAIGMIDQQRNQGFNNQLGALSGYGSLYGAGQDRSLNAANSASQIQAANRDRQLNGISGQGGTFQGGIGQGLQAAGMGLGQQNQNQDRRMAGLGGQLNAATTAANFQGQNADRQMNAQNSLFGQGQTGMNNLGNSGSVYQNMLQGQNAPNQNMMGVGSYYEDLAGRQLNDQLRISQEQNGGQLAQLQALFAAANGAGGYGTQYQTAQGPRNGLSNGLGALLGGGSLLSSLFGG